MRFRFGEDIVDHNVWLGFYDDFCSFSFAHVGKPKGKTELCLPLDDNEFFQDHLVGGTKLGSFSHFLCTISKV